MDTRRIGSALALIVAVSIAGCDNATPSKTSAPPAPSKGAGQVAGPKATTGAPAAGPKPAAEAPKQASGTIPAPKPAGEVPVTKPAPGATGSTGPATPPAASPPKPVDPPKPAAPQPAPPKQPEVLETIDKNGVLIEVLSYGTGAEAKPMGVVKMHYRGTLVDGTEFDNSYKRQEPLEKPLSALIKGWQEGIPGMKVGGKRRLTVPPDMGYGGRDIRDGQGKIIIPANSMLVFEVELLDAK
jgi:hypothetical protein